MSAAEIKDVHNANDTKGDDDRLGSGKGCFRQLESNETPTSET
uniref:Uncharacterized protein n=1 Tax=Anguilla anguilla TaxID=7936 RepID=A0A0E9TZ10_ANGAN